MDAQQRLYIVERIKNEFNTTVEPLRKNKNKSINNYPTLLTVKDAIKNYIENGSNEVIHSVEFNGNPWFIPSTEEPIHMVSIRIKPISQKQIDYTDIIRKMTEEKNRVIDQIMLGDVPNAAEILANFVTFMKTEKEKLNVN